MISRKTEDGKEKSWKEEVKNPSGDRLGPRPGSANFLRNKGERRKVVKGDRRHRKK